MDASRAKQFSVHLVVVATAGAGAFGCTDLLGIDGAYREAVTSAGGTASEAPPVPSTGGTGPDIVAPPAGYPDAGPDGLTPPVHGDAASVAPDASHPGEGGPAPEDGGVDAPPPQPPVDAGCPTCPKPLCVTGTYEGHFNGAHFASSNVTKFLPAEFSVQGSVVLRVRQSGAGYLAEGELRGDVGGLPGVTAFKAQLAGEVDCEHGLLSGGFVPDSYITIANNRASLEGNFQGTFLPGGTLDGTWDETEFESFSFKGSGTWSSVLQP